MHPSLDALIDSPAVGYIGLHAMTLRARDELDRGDAVAVARTLDMIKGFLERKLGLETNTAHHDDHANRG